MERTSILALRGNASDVFEKLKSVTPEEFEKQKQLALQNVRGRK